MRSALPLWVNAGNFHSRDHLNTMPLTDDFTAHRSGKAIMVCDGNGFDL